VDWASEHVRLFQLEGRWPREMLFTDLVGADGTAAHPARPRVTNWAAAQHQVSRFFFLFFLFSVVCFLF
jgi:hypothetical protein